jgi:hypothetical protein
MNILSGVIGTLARPSVRFVTGVCLTVAAFATNSAQADPTDNSLQIYAVQVLCCSEQSMVGAGIYLGRGLVITAAHVLIPNRPGVQIDGVNMAATIVKRGTFEQIDLALLSIDEKKLPVNMRLLRMPLCQTPPQVGAPVIVAAPQGITRSRIVSPLPRFSTLISDVETSGKSGSGVFDVENKCLLGILSLKITNNIEHKDIATYFVPASTIQSFVPTGTRW